MGNSALYDITLGGVQYRIDHATYGESGPSTRVLDRQMYQTATGELDFEPSWPYTQRSFILGEKQYFTHEADEMKNTAYRRYQEGHGIDISKEGEVGLLKTIARSLNPGANPTTCPMIASKDGLSVYAFPAGGTKMYKYTAGAWDTGETITSCTAPVLDAYMAGNGDIYIVDSTAAGSRLRKRAAAGGWSQITPTTTTMQEGETEVLSSGAILAADTKYLCRIPITFAGTIATATLAIDGQGGGAGSQVCKCVIYQGDADGDISTLLGTSGEVTVTAGALVTQQPFTFSSPVSVSAGYIWVGLICGATSNIIRWRYREATGQYMVENADVYTGGAEATYSWGATFNARVCSANVTLTYVPGGWATTAYNDATAVVWINGEVYVITPSAVYCHSLDTLCSEFCGGSIACTHDGALYWSDGSNKVYEYNGVGAREVVGQLPPGFAIQCLFSAHARMWICGKLSNGDAAVYWFGQGQYGVLDFFPAAAGSTRNIYAGAASDEYVIFADSRYGGTIRHYVPEGGWSHYLAYGSAVTIPYKGVVTGAGKTFIALATGVAGTQGIYCDGTTYVTSGTLTASQADLQMPAHQKRWMALILNTLPLRAGESIGVEVSADGGRTWVAQTAMSGTGTIQYAGTFDYESPTFQYRLTLTAGTSQATDPKLLSTTMRALPLVTNGRQWKCTILGLPAGPVGGSVVTEDDARMKALCDTINDAQPLAFIDPFGDTWRVTAAYVRKLAYGAGVNRSGSILEVTLTEQT